MKKCSYCNYTNNDGAMYCAKCGKKVIEEIYETPKKAKSSFVGNLFKGKENELLKQSNEKLTYENLELQRKITELGIYDIEQS